MARKVELNRSRFKPLHYSPVRVERLFHWLDQQSGFAIPAGDLSIAFLDEEGLAQVHADFLDDPSPTDVITFPGDPDDDFAGEILVSVERAVNEAPKHEQTFAEELTLYLVHGWLHLAGLDDIEKDDRQMMRSAEIILMSRIHIDELIPDFRLKY